MTYDEINALTVEDCVAELFIRLTDISPVPEGEMVYEWDEDEELSNYERLIPNEALEKPSLEDMEAELTVYQAELTAAEDARLAEIARKEDLYARVQTMLDRDAGFPAFYAVVSDVPNHAVYLKGLIEDKDRAAEAESLIAQIEGQDFVLASDIEANEYKELRAAAYPPVEDYLDAMVKLNSGDATLASEGQTQLDAYYAACLAVKDQYPKP